MDGIHEAIISNLAHISELKVIFRTPEMRYKDADKLMPEIVRELGVDALVEGSVLKAGDRVCTIAQWNGRDSSGRQVPSGIYIARLVTPEYSKMIKMALLK